MKHLNKYSDYGYDKYFINELKTFFNETQLIELELNDIIIYYKNDQFMVLYKKDNTYGKFYPEFFNFKEKDNILNYIKSLTKDEIEKLKIKSNSKKYNI